MAQNETWLKHDLMKAVRVQYLDGNLFSMDNAGNLIGVTLTRDGEDYAGGGSVSANVIRADGGTVTVTGALSGNAATVVLPQAAYVVPGAVSIVVKLTASGQVTTIAAIVANVYRSSTDTPIDPGTIIPSVQALISAIDTAVASIPADYSSLWASLAPAFSTSSAYTAGQYVTYNGGLYRFTADHAAGAWNSSHVVAVNIGDELSDLKSALNDGYKTLDTVIKSGFKHSMPDINLAETAFSGTKGYYKTSDGSWYNDNSVKSTGMVYIKGYDTITAVGYLNKNGYAIAFLDASMNLIPALSVTNDSSSPIRTEITNVDLTQDTYKIAYYCMVCAYTNSGAIGSLVLTQNGNFNNDYDYVKTVADSEMNNVILFQKMNDYKATGYYKVSTGKFVETSDIASSGLIPIKQGANVVACSYVGNIAYAVCFLNKDKQVISGISVAGGSSSPAWEYHNIDCSSIDYADIAYVFTGAYTGMQGGGYLFVTYPSNSKIKNFDTQLASITMENILLNSNYGFSTNKSYGGNSIYSTKIVPFSNKYVTKITAKTFLNNTYYKLVFLDEKMNLLTSISLINSSSSVQLNTDTIDVTGSSYNNARYVMATTYGNTNGEFLTLYSNSFINKLNHELDFPTTNKLLNKQTARIFKKVVCVGDSYTAGWHKVSGDSDWSDHPEYAWPHYISDITGNDWLNCGVSGATVLSWMTNANGYQRAQSYGVTQAYVIGLMINDTASVPLGTSDDIGSENPTTYYGGLAKLVRALASLSPNAHIFVNTCPKSGVTYANFNQAVRDVVTAYTGTYKVHLMDLSAHEDMYSKPSFTGDAINGHYTAIGYEQMANIYCYLLSDYINNHISTFQDVYKIPFDPVS